MTISRNTKVFFVAKFRIHPSLYSYSYSYVLNILSREYFHCVFTAKNVVIVWCLLACCPPRIAVTNLTEPHHFYAAPAPEKN
jgi:hypothetical protein